MENLKLRLLQYLMPMFLKMLFYSLFNNNNPFVLSPYNFFSFCSFTFAFEIFHVSPGHLLGEVKVFLYQFASLFLLVSVIIMRQITRCQAFAECFDCFDVNNIVNYTCLLFFEICASYWLAFVHVNGPLNHVLIGLMRVIGEL